MEILNEKLFLMYPELEYHFHRRGHEGRVSCFFRIQDRGSIRSYYVDKVIFSCKALDQERGIMESQESFGTTKKVMLSSGRRKILVVDSTKFDQTAFSVAGKLRDIDVVVTDRKPSERWIARFTDAGIECRYPE